MTWEVYDGVRAFNPAVPLAQETIMIPCAHVGPWGKVIELLIRASCVVAHLLGGRQWGCV
jgi:hypothetical protein